MKKKVIYGLGMILTILCYYTSVHAIKVFDSDWQLPEMQGEEQSQFRIVLITKDIDTPFWDLVGQSAEEEAKDLGVSLEIWGDYGYSHENLLKNLEIAIQSKVDGIIIQGADTDQFNEMARVKASFYGVPIITVANDVPVNESLRKTYIGSDQFKAGQIVAEQLIEDMGSVGKVVLMYEEKKEFYQHERLKGIEEILTAYEEIEIYYAPTSVSRDEIIGSTQEVLNRVPDVDAFIAVEAYAVGTMVAEIGKRFQITPFFIYSFDDSPESMNLLVEGKIDGVLKQTPTEIGRKSVRLLTEWLHGETVPLDSNGYFTEIQIIKEADIR